MRMMKTVLMVCGAMALVLVASAAAQREREPDTLPALLTEVRGIRAALEQSTIVGPRVQLALGRLQLQEQRVNTMLRRLESLRDARRTAEGDEARTQNEAQALEKLVKEQLRDMPQGSKEADHPMAAILQRLRQGAAAAATEVQDVRAEAQQLEQQIAAEQGRWVEINRVLEELERTLRR
jgi:chromosome segregation ATPase